MASFLLAHGYVGWQFYPSIQQQYQGVSLHFDAEEWFLMRSGQREGLALKATTVWPWVIVLNFYALTSGKSQALLVFSDSCSADDYRHLKIHLKSAKSFT